MTEGERLARIAEVHAQEMQTPAAWYWLSFADETGFLGAAMVRAHGITTAVVEAKRLGIHPGGSVLCHPIDEPPETLKNVLLTKEQAYAAIETMKRMRT
jgi:hypothetical protein